MSVFASLRLACFLPLLLAALPASAQPEALLPLTGAADVANGAEHACVLATDGKVLCWGNNGSGQLADGTEFSSATARPVNGLPGPASALASGFAHSCAVVSGAVWCWGDNFYGQLGDNSTDNRKFPVAVQGLPAGVTAISVGNVSSCAIAAGGLWCWGFNGYGSLGDGSGNDSLVPVAVAGLGSGVTQVSVGVLHACALVGGAARCWGNNASGQVGNGSAAVVIASPVTVSGLASGVVAISAGAIHTCATLATGVVKCWGDNEYGELGTQTVTDSLVPVDADELTAPARGVATGGSHTCVVGNDGIVRCWGVNTYAQLGRGDAAGGPVPVTPAGIGGAVHTVSAKGSYSCAQRVDGGVSCWGLNTSEQVGNGSAAVRAAPVVLPNVEAVSAVAAGTLHTCAVIAGGVSCWGYNGEGAIGTGQVSLAETFPTPVAPLTGGATAVAGGGDHSCAVVNGAAWCWGKNEFGQLGNGSTDDSPSPVMVSGMSSGVTAIAAAGSQTCAIREGRAWCWGYNGSGRLGDGTQNNANMPVAVSGLGNAVSAIAVGYSHTCAVEAGAAKCWGLREFGQLGDGLDSGFSAVPAAVQGLGSGVSAISAGVSHTCAIVNGAARCWGWDGYAQLGNGIVNDTQLIPDAVTGLDSGVTAIAAGEDISCAMKDATVLCWGADYDGDLGNGNPPRSLRAVPTAAFGLVGRAAGGIAIGGTHVCAGTTAGGLACWGDDYTGTLGIGRQLIVPKPANVVVDDRIFAGGFD